MVLFNSPKFQYDRDVANMEALSKRQQNGRILHEEVIETAGDTGANFHDVNHVAQAMQEMTAMGAASWQLQENLGRTNMQ